MPRLFTAAVLGLMLAFTATAIAEPLTTTPVAKKKKKCFKKKRGKRVRVKCKAKKKAPATQTPTTQTPTSTTPTGQPDVTGQAAIDQMTNELKGGRWVYFTSSSQSSTRYVLNLCADGKFLRTGETAGVLVYRYGTWKLTDAAILGDGSRRGGHVSGTTIESDPPPDGSTYEADVIADRSTGADQWYVNDLAAQYFPGAAQCSG